ncbi:pyruvate kinase [Hyphomonas pacifica]|uniref:Pyruvate kinase n=1 Tax=Hyphomonas pacifica TaxID=1280941 RepID=A0A062TZW1_9PROT|nr:pyruvate kinase [Hyphomonas pacifica]KCZ49027.1 pyruvate kinase [Hyphomonas pacifica]RAN32223.1 pyruvate kinase [Hyphomonas pacifica]RAN35944.1 pyruvate kinase [Hyphomonas pacifica]
MGTKRLSGENAKIVATLGPGSRSPREVLALAYAGVDVFRLNFSHGEHAAHQEALNAVRAAEKESGRPLATLGDLQGPKVRVGSLPNGELRLRYKQEYALIAAETTDAEETIPVPHAEIVDMLEEGDVILVDDGKLIFTVTAVGDVTKVRADVPGKLTDKKGFTVRGKALPVRALTEKDRKDLDFALEIGVDIIALSFAQTVEDVEEVKAIINGRAPLVSKLEKPAAIANLDAIVEASDAVMVARGDLGVEFAPEEVPIIQRRIVRCARGLGRPVIVATQMLESMIENAAPTRAEASDVATAIYQGADAVMLSAETAVGRHPATTVTIMSRIIRATEEAEDYRRSLSQFSGDVPARNAIDVVAETAQGMAEAEGATALALRTGAFARLARFARVRGAAPILYGSLDDQRLRTACLLWGVHPQRLNAGADYWYRDLMDAAGLDGRVAYARWAGDDQRFAWEVGVGKGEGGEKITGV